MLAIILYCGNVRDLHIHRRENAPKMRELKRKSKKKIILLL